MAEKSSSPITNNHTLRLLQIALKDNLNATLGKASIVKRPPLETGREPSGECPVSVRWCLVVLVRRAAARGETTLNRLTGQHAAHNLHANKFYLLMITGRLTNTRGDLTALAAQWRQKRGRTPRTGVFIYYIVKDAKKRPGLEEHFRARDVLSGQRGTRQSSDFH